MKIRAYIFDLDGVLWDSTKIHILAFLKILKKFSINNFDYKLYAGWKTDQIFQHLFSLNNINISSYTLKLLVKEKRQYASFLLKKDPPIFEECISTIKILSQHFRLAIVSSSQKSNINTFLKSTKLTPLFNVIISGDDTINGKPSPDLYHLALQRLSLSSNEVLVVEDSLAGIQSSISAGIKTIGITTTHCKEILSTMNLFRIIDSLSELLKDYEKNL